MEGANFNVTYFPAAFATVTVDQINEAVEYMSAAQTQVQIYGRYVPIPRRQAAYCVPGPHPLSYTFSGHTALAKPWPPLIADLRERVCAKLGIVEEANKPNFALVNLYENETNHISFHRDSEPDMDMSKPIISTSHGCKRTFRLRPYRRPSEKKKQAAASPPSKKVKAAQRHVRFTAEKPTVETQLAPHEYVDVELGGGDLLCMNPPTNERCEHSIIKCRTPKGPRINITWRFIKPRK